MAIIRRKQCKYCGEWFEPYGYSDVGNVYCSGECRVEHGQAAIRQKYGEQLQKNYARKSMEQIETGILDERLKECKRRGITYADLQMEKTLKEGTKIMIEDKGRFILERKIDGEWYEYGRYDENHLTAMIRAGAMIIEQGQIDIRVRREGVEE